MICYACKCEYEAGPGRRRTCSVECAVKLRGRGGRAIFPRVAHHLGSKPRWAPAVPYLDDALVYLETPPRERKVMCRRYEGCLDHAAGQDWTGWTCAGCPVSDVISPSEARNDLNGLADLLYEVMRIEEY